MRFLFFLVHVALSMPWNPRAALEDYYDDMTGNFGPEMVKTHKLKFQKYSYENFSSATSADYARKPSRTDVAEEFI